MNFVKHFFKRHLCVSNVYINDDNDSVMPDLRCNICGEKIGFIYSIDTQWKTHIYQKFKRYEQRIERWVDEHTKNRNHMGNSYEREWGEVLYNIKQWHEDGVLPMGCEEWDDGGKEDSEGCESNGFGETYEDGLENQKEEETDVVEVDCRECMNCDMKVDKCTVHGKDPSNAVSECVANGFNDYKPKQ